MRGFLLKVGLYIALLLGAHLIAGYFADGFTDAYYLRFTGDREQNLIIGTSRAAQGIRPEYITGYEDQFFNYAFTLGHSPYGEVYRSSIIKKASPELDGKFIVAVDPWSISASSVAPHDERLFKDKEREVGTTSCVTCTPNYEYLLENYPFGWGKMILWRIKQNPSVHELHADGWLEIEVPMDPRSQESRTKKKMKEYAKNIKSMSPSEVRIASLQKTLTQLNESGEVYMIRLPVPAEMKLLEAAYMPEFDSLMTSLAQRSQVPYYDMTLLPDTFRYIDGNHLYHASARSVSQAIGNFISRNDLHNLESTHDTLSTSTVLEILH